MNDKPVNYPAAFGYLNGSVNAFVCGFETECLKRGLYVDPDVFDLMNKKLRELPTQAEEYSKSYELKY